MSLALAVHLPFLAVPFPPTPLVLTDVLPVAFSQHNRIFSFWSRRIEASGQIGRYHIEEFALIPRSDTGQNSSIITV